MFLKILKTMEYNKSNSIPKKSPKVVGSVGGENPLPLSVLVGKRVLLKKINAPEINARIVEYDKKGFIKIVDRKHLLVRFIKISDIEDWEVLSDGD